jgi:hypothetical protein
VRTLQVFRNCVKPGRGRWKELSTRALNPDLKDVASISTYLISPDKCSGGIAFGLVEIAFCLSQAQPALSAPGEGLSIC